MVSTFSVPGHVTAVSPLEICGGGAEFPKESNCDVPKWLIQSVLCSLPSDVITMSLASKTQNKLEQCTGDVLKWYIWNVPHFWYKLGKLWENAGKFLNVPGFPVTGGKGTWKQVGTCQKHLRARIYLPAMLPLDTF